MSRECLRAKQETSKSSIASINLLQRKCVCGGASKLSGECAECSRQNLVGRNSTNVQPKLKISQPNNKYEQEADRVADMVMRMPDPKIQREMSEKEDEDEETVQTKSIGNTISSSVQRRTDNEEDDEEQVQLKTLNSINTIQRQEVGEEDEEETIQTKEVTGQTPAVNSEIQSQIESARQSGGKPLSRETRAFMEPRFGQDFSQVRIHTDRQADSAAKNLQARAFTFGSHVVFGKGEFDPYTVSGRQLLAHELTHSIQQSTSGQKGQVQRRKLTKEERRNDSPELKKAKRRTGRLRGWLDRIAKKSLDDLEPRGLGKLKANRYIRWAKWVKLLEGDKEIDFVNLTPKEKSLLDKLTTVRFKSDQPIDITPDQDVETACGPIELFTELSPRLLPNGYLHGTTVLDRKEWVSALNSTRKEKCEAKGKFKNMMLSWDLGNPRLGRILGMDINKNDIKFDVNVHVLYPRPIQESPCCRCFSGESLNWDLGVEISRKVGAKEEKGKSQAPLVGSKTGKKCDGKKCCSIDEIIPIDLEYNIPSFNVEKFRINGRASIKGATHRN